MKTLVINTKTGKQEIIDDGLPEPISEPFVILEGLDLAEAAKLVKELKTARVEIDDLKATLIDHDRRLKKEIGGHIR